MPEKYYAEKLEITVGSGTELGALADRLKEHYEAGWKLASFAPQWGDSQRDGRYATGNVVITLRREHSGSAPHGVTERLV